MENRIVLMAVFALGMAGLSYLWILQTPSYNLAGRAMAFSQDYPGKGCNDQCSFGGTVCYNNEVHYCADQNSDGCLEEVFVKSCFGKQCINGECANVLYCGNNECEGGEHCGNCPKDCGLCSSATSYDEIEYAKKYPEPYCGNGRCESGENCQTCQKDCGYCNYSYTVRCGDGYCNGNEDCYSCHQDCGYCNYANGHSCSRDIDCWGGHCVNGLCRSSAYYCGDGECDEGETCSSCQSDCGKCVAFTISEAYSSSSDKIIRTGENHFTLIFAGNPYSSVSIPVYFNESSENVYYSFTCNGIGGISFSASSFIEKANNKDQWVSINKSGVYIKSYFSSITADPFVLKNGLDQGPYISIAGEGSARIIFFIYSFPDQSAEVLCRFGITSGSPYYSKSTEITLLYNKA